MRRTNFALASITALSLAACATAPKQACTADWIEYEVQDIYKDLRRDTRDELNDFKAIAAALEDPDRAASPWLAFRLVGLAKDVEYVVDTYVETYQPRFQTIADICDKPELVVDALGDFLREEGAPETVVVMLQDFSILMTEEDG